ncbi:DUF317 domain-containing protein [Streptomyces sp. SCSIO 30461]|uniref:DUF317 domain-containing protein n=1 Tax=Streptomyces sp. SCSIO 30461 TaxID=3118085 RepID=UPI0030D54314
MPPHLHPDHDTPVIDGDVYVRPRHLARATGTGDPALAPLTALGWSLRHDDLGNAYVHAPDDRVRLGFLPEGEDDGLWRINAYKDPFAPPTWGVCFNDSVPTEFVTAFTTALATAYEQGPDAYLARPDPRVPDRDPFRAVAPLTDRGWLFARPDPDVFSIQSPDKLASLDHTVGPLSLDDELNTREARWHLWAGTSINRPLWYATASTDTPVALITAVTECVADPAPLARWREATFSYAAGMAHLTPIEPDRPSAPTPLDVQRAVSLRPTPPRVTASVPRWSTTTSRPAPSRR